ncbi:MAG: hypothetical protein U1D55_10660 [Phycisphaerae bacterium]
MSWYRVRLLTGVSIGVLLVGCESREAPRVAASQPRAIAAAPSNAPSAAAAPAQSASGGSPAATPLQPTSAAKSPAQSATPGTRSPRTENLQPQAATPSKPAASESQGVDKPSPHVPEYVTILDRAPRFGFEAQTSGSSVLTITSENVRRIRLDRALIPLDRTHSITIRIDGYGIEWTPRRERVELERSPNGAWRVAESK